MQYIRTFFLTIIIVFFTGEFFHSLSAQGCPDLIITEIIVDNADATGIQYTFTIQNIGDVGVDMNTFSVQAFVSEDDVFNNGNDVAAGGTIVTASSTILNPNETYTRSFQGGGSYDYNTHPYLTLMVDWLTAITECDETNNTLAVLIFPPPIPTLSEWGFISLMLIMIIIGIRAFYCMQKQRRLII